MEQSERRILARFLEHFLMTKEHPPEKPLIEGLEEGLAEYYQNPSLYRMVFAMPDKSDE